VVEGLIAFVLETAHARQPALDPNLNAVYYKIAVHVFLDGWWVLLEAAN